MLDDEREALKELPFVVRALLHYLRAEEKERIHRINMCARFPLLSAQTHLNHVMGGQCVSNSHCARSFSGPGHWLSRLQTASASFATCKHRRAPSLIRFEFDEDRDQNAAANERSSLRLALREIAARINQTLRLVEKLPPRLQEQIHSSIGLFSRLTSWKLVQLKMRDWNEKLLRRQ